MIARVPHLTRDRVLGAALVLADRDGVGAVTMRAVAGDLGVEAMALYRHVRNKDELLDGLAVTIVTEINRACDRLPEIVGDWKAAARARMLTARSIMLRHPWAPNLISSRGTLSLELMDYFERLCGILIDGGFSMDLVHHTIHALGSRALGFSPELFEPDAAIEHEDDTMADLEAFADRFPHATRMVTELSHDASSTLGWCDDQEEFEFGLDVLLDGIEARRRSSR